MPALNAVRSKLGSKAGIEEAKVTPNKTGERNRVLQETVGRTKKSVL
jgi:hypothetical protein